MISFAIFWWSLALINVLPLLSVLTMQAILKSQTLRVWLFYVSISEMRCATNRWFNRYLYARRSGYLNGRKLSTYAKKYKSVISKNVLANILILLVNYSTFFIAFSAQATSRWPPGAPPTPIAPTTFPLSSSGRPPAKNSRFSFMFCNGCMIGLSAMSFIKLPVGCFMLADVKAFLRELSRVWTPAPSDRNWAMTWPYGSTTVADTL